MHKLFVMDNSINKTIRDSHARMRARRKLRDTANNTPCSRCNNCGNTLWEFDQDDEWYCFICSNRGYWENRKFIQGNKNRGY